MKATAFQEMETEKRLGVVTREEKEQVHMERFEGGVRGGEQELKAASYIADWGWRY